MEARVVGSAILPLQAHRGSTADGPVWLIATPRKEVCLFAGRPLESSCVPTSRALQNGITLGIIEHPDDPTKRLFVLYGVVPDGQSHVQVQVGDGSATTITVTDGAFSVRSREPVNKL